MDDTTTDEVTDMIQVYLEQAGLIEKGEFEGIREDVEDLATTIVSHVESSYGM
ncbi:hypothetical protein [Streptacidiphilus sp. PAMC 29251]